MATPLSILTSPSSADSISALRQAPARNSQTSDTKQTFRDTLAEYEPAVKAPEAGEKVETSAEEPVDTDSENSVEGAEAQSEKVDTEQNDQPSEDQAGEQEAGEEAAEQNATQQEGQSEPVQSAPQADNVQPAQQANVAAQPLPETSINLQPAVENREADAAQVQRNAESTTPVQREVPLEPVQKTETEAPVQRSEEPVRQQTNENHQVRQEVDPLPQQREETTETSRSSARTSEAPIAPERPAAETNNTRPVESSNTGRVNAQERNVQTPQAVQATAPVEGAQIKTDDNITAAKREIDTAQPAANQTPAAARAAQVETAVRLENIASELSQSDGETRSAGPRISIAPTVNTNIGSATIGSGNVEQLFTPGKVEVDETEFSNRIVRGLSTMVNQRGGVMTMRLQPPVLGELKIQMSIVQGTVNAQFTATSEHAQMLLDRSITVLRNSLESQGLTVEKIGVQLNSAEQSNNTARNENGEQQQQNNQRSSHDAAGGESRGRHESGTRQDQAPAGGKNAFSAFADSLGSFSFSESPFVQSAVTGVDAQ